MKKVFLEPRIEGPRFDEHTIPLDVLKEWSVLEELIIEVARWLYMKENPNRQRVPRGFSENFTLHLSGIKQGSACPVIERIYNDGPLELDSSDWFDRARDIVLSTIKNKTENASYDIDTFPRELLGYFDRFGRTLSDNDKIVFTSTVDEHEIVYDKRVRKKLVLTTSHEYRSSAELRGSIPEVDVEKQTFTLKLLSGVRVMGSFSPELNQTVVAGVSQFKKSKVLVKGLVVYDQNDNPKKIEETSHIEILDSNDVKTRLEELSLLEDGWMDGDGKALEYQGLSWLSDTWFTNYKEELPTPFFYPTVKGEIQIEWSFGKRETSMEINLDTHKAEYLVVDLSTETPVGRTLNLDSKEDWEWLISQIKMNG